MALTPVTKFPWAPGGVMLFFLVSGFLMPSALKSGGGRFLVGRAFRVLPVLWVVFGASLLLYHSLVASGTVLEIPFTEQQIITNFLLVNDLAWQPFIEAGVWTLVVEVKFYLLLWFALLIFQRVEPPQIMIIALFLVIMQIGFASSDGQNLYQHLFEVLSPAGLGGVYFFVRVLNENIPFIIFILCGSIVWFLWSGKLKFAQAFVYVACLMWMFVVTHLCSPIGKLQPSYIGVAFQVLACFCLAAGAETCVRRGWLGGPSIARWLAPVARRPVRFFANVSYPLYLLHGSALGWPVLILMVNALKDPALVMAVAVPSVFAIAWLLHKFVEVPAISLGRDLQRLYLDRASRSVELQPS